MHIHRHMHIMHDVYTHIHTQFFNGKIRIRKSMPGVVSAVTAMEGINSPQISCAKKNACNWQVTSYPDHLYFT